MELDQEEAKVTAGILGIGFEGRADRTCYILPRSLADDPTLGDSWKAGGLWLCRVLTSVIASSSQIHGG